MPWVRSGSGTQEGGAISFESLDEYLFRLDVLISRLNDRSHTSNLHPAKFAELHHMAPLLQRRKAEALLLGIGPHKRPIRVQPTASKPKIGNVLDMGPSQCGKSTRSIAQDLDWVGSLVVNDIKREIRGRTAGWRELWGPSFTIDITGRGNQYDPLEGRISERQLYDSAYLLLYDPNDKEKYFTERATRMLTQLFLAAREETRILQEANPFAKEVRPLPYVGRLIGLGFNRVAAIINTISPPLAEKFLEAEYDPLKDYEANKARIDAWSTLVNRLYPILTDDLLPTFDGCDFTARDLLYSKTPITVYFCWPESQLSSLKPLIRLVVGSLMQNLTDAYDFYPQKVRQNVLFDLDEAGVTDLPDLPEKSATLNGRGISLSLNAQDIEQFFSLYGQYRANSLLSNLESKVMHRPASLHSAEYFCKWLDRTSEFASSRSTNDRLATEGETEREVSLLTVRELAELNDEDVLVFHRNYKPIHARRMGIDEYPALAQRQAIQASPLLLLPTATTAPSLTELRQRMLASGRLRIPPGTYRLEPGYYRLPLPD